MKKIVSFFLLSFSFLYSSAQEMDEMTRAVHGFDYSREYTVAEIQVSGAEMYGYEKDILMSMSGLFVGDRVTIPGEKITKALKAFLKQGLFSWGKVIATKQTADSVWLEFIVESNPTISDIIFSGVKKKEKEDLESKIGISRGSRLTPNSIDYAEKQIREYFESKGFSRVEIQIQHQSDLANEGKAVVDILIRKNEKIRVRRICLFGNHSLSDYTLKVAMKKTNEGFSFKEKPLLSLRKLFVSNIFIQEEYRKDLERIIFAYNEHGYLNASIVSDSILLVNDKKIDIHLTIDEGNQYMIRSIRWIGNTLYSSDRLSCLLAIRAGDTYNQRKLQARLFTDEDAIANLYYNNGYIFSSINPMEVRIENDSVDLEIRLWEGTQATVNQVNINGNNRVYESVIRRELSTKPGQLFSKESLIRSAREIAQMGYFDPEKINIQPIPDNESGTVNIYYNLTSKTNDQVEFSAGYGQAGVVGRVSLKFSNFSFQNMVHWKEYRGIIPQGDGQSLTFSGQTNGRYYQSYSVSFLEPWFGGKRPNSFSLSAYYMLQDSMKTWNDTNKHIQIFGLSSGYGKRLNWPDNYFVLTSDLSYQRYWLKDWQVFSIHNGTANNLTLGFTLSRNSTDNPVYTRCGSIFSLSVNATPPYSLCGLDNGKSEKSDSTMFRWVEYHKWKFKGRIFIPLANREKVKRTPVLMNRIEYGLVGTYSSKKYNLFGTFDMGGDGMTGYSTSLYTNDIIGLRGYEAGALTSKGDGHAYTRLALELRYPLLLEQVSTVYGLVFLEAGNAWKEVKAFHPFQLKRSAGVGIRIMLPMIGLMGFDWAYGFDKSNNQSDKVSGSQFHFILGQEF